MDEETIKLHNDADVVAAWKAALLLGRRLGFGLFKQACLTGAVLELCRGVIERGGKGSCSLSDGSDARGLRARVVIDGCSSELLGAAPGRLSREICVGPALPSVRLHQVAETLEAEPQGAGVRLTLTIHQGRSAGKTLSRPPISARAAR